LTIILLVVGVGPLLAFGLFMLEQQKASLSAESERSMQVTAETISAQVDDWFDKNVRALRAAASLPGMISMKREEQVSVLRAIQKEYPWMYLVHTVGLNAFNVARSDNAPFADHSDRQYFKDLATGGKDLAWSVVIGKTTGKPALIIAVPIRDNGNLVGVLISASSIEATSKIVANWRSGQTGFAFLVDEGSYVLAHPRNDLVQTRKRLDAHPMVAAYRADEKPHLLKFVDDGQDTLGYVRGNPAGWAVVVQQSQKELFAPLQSTLTITVILLIGASLLVAGLCVAASRMLVRPIVEMTAAAAHMSLGELETPVVGRGNDEISMLARSLERLRKSMRAAMERL
jgi:methyl-accepting chemotaxis protein